jgi:transposase InsO family protein
VFVDALRPEKFSSVHFKRWQIKCTLWLEAMHVFWVSKDKPEGNLLDADLQGFTEANTLFVGCILSALTDRLCDVYMHIKDGKELWDALDAKFGASDAGSELYIMESFHDFKMVNDKSIVQQAHDIQCIAKELEILKCPLPDPFVAGCIIAKLPSSWRSFATALKHKRTKISVEELIASLDVEEKARAKDTKGGEGHSVANTVQNQRNQGSKGKGKFKPNKTTNFKKKKNKAELPCFTCGELGHFSKDCPERADRRGKRGGNGQPSKTVNTVTAGKTGDAGYGNLPTVLSVFQSVDWWIDTGANVHVCTDSSMFSSYQVTRDCTVLMGNGSAASVLGTGTVDLKFTSGKIVQLKNVQHVPSMNKNLVSGSLLCRDGFKVVLESNKVVVSRHGLFIGKGYDCGGLFRLSLLDFSNKCVNHICGGVNDDASLWHSRLCHVNFGLMKQLSSMSLIPSFTFAKGSKCHSCVQSKQPRKPHKAAEERNLAPLELIHSDLCEMNGVLTKGGKRYFMTLIDDATRFCYVYLLKSKDETLDYFKIYKAEVETQLERKIKRLRSDRGGEYFPKVFDDFCAEHGIIHERTPPYSPESNGIAERKNRTLTDLVNSMLDTAGLSKAWWGEAILTSCHVLNRIPNRNKDKTSYEEWIGRKPSLSYLRTWGCLAKVNVPINKKRKLGPKTVDCVFLGYAHHSIAYRFLVVKSDVPDMYVDSIMESRDATFFENIFPMKDMHSTSSFSSEITPELNAPIEISESPLEKILEEDDNEAPRKSKRQRVENPLVMISLCTLWMILLRL